MAQIIRHRKGVLESVSGATKRLAELLIVTGSSAITSTNSNAMVFFGDGTDATPANKVLYGTATPDLTGAAYSTAVDGIPFYNTSEEKLYILAKGGNQEVKATANTGGTGIISGSSQIAALGANIVSGSGQISIVTNGTNVYSSSTQVAADILSDNRSIDLGTGNFDANGITADGSLNVTGLTSVGIISGSSLDLTGNAHIQGNLTLGGNITIGDASGDTISFGGEISSDVIPSANNTYDLGSATDKFAEVHATSLFGALNATNGVISGSSQLDGTTIGSTSNSAFIGTFTGQVNANNGVVSGSAQTITNLNGINIVSGSSDSSTIEFDITDGVVSANAIGGVVSGSSQVDIDDVTGFTSYSSSVDARTVALESAVGAGSNIDGRLSSLETFSASAESNDTELFATASDHETRVDDLETFQSDIETAITVNGQNVTIAGNFTVSGTQTVVDSTTVQIGDNIIELNGSGAANGGLLVKDATAPNTNSGSLLWDSTNDYWKAGVQGAESQILVAGGMGVVSGSEQIDLENVVGDTDDVTEGSSNLYYTDARVKTKLDAETVISGSSQVQLGSVTGFTDYSSSVDTRLTQAANDLDSTIKTKLNTEGVLSGSAQVIAALPSGVISGSAITTDGSTIVAVGDTVGNVGDLENGVQLSLGGNSGLSGILTFDESGTAKSFDYTAGDVRYIDTAAGVSVAIKANAEASTAWVFDTDGDLVSGGGVGSTGALWAGRAVINGAVSGSELLITGNAKIDGNLTLGGNIQIGNADTDTIAFGGDLTTDIIPDVTNTVDLGSSSKKFAEVYATTFHGDVTGDVTGVINATNGVISGSSQLDGETIDTAVLTSPTITSAEASGSFSGSFEGVFVGDGSGITGLSTTISVSGSDGSNDTVSLLDGALSFAGGTGVSTAVATDTVTISVQDASTSVKGIASFGDTNFTVTSGNVVLKAGDGATTSGGVLGSNLNADVAGTGLTYSLSNQQLDVDYGSSSGTAVEGNTTISVSGTANEIEITGTTAQALGGGASYTIGLPDAVTIATASIQNDLSVGGNAVITGNLSVLGTTTTIDSTTVQIGDNIIELNYGGAQSTAGIQVTDATGGNLTSGSLIWNGTDDVWTAGALGSEKELARLNSSPTANTVLKADANGLLVDSVLSDDGTDATFSGDLSITGLNAGANGAFLYVDSSDKLVAVDASTAGDVIQWNGSSFVASNELDGGTF